VHCSVVNAALTQLLGSLPSSTSEDSPVGAEAVESEGKLFSLVRRHLKLLGSTSSSTAEESEDNAAEGQSKLRFLSLLRRINELRSQQVDVRWSWMFERSALLLMLCLPVASSWICSRPRAGMVCRTPRSLHSRRSSTNSASTTMLATRRRRTARLITRFVRCAVTSLKRRKRCARCRVCTSTTASASTSGSCTTASARSASTLLPSTRLGALPRNPSQSSLSLCISEKGSCQNSSMQVFTGLQSSVLPPHQVQPSPVSLLDLVIQDAQIACHHLVF
jgi:hypothetical protein